MHSGKTPKHSGKASPSATLGEGLPGKQFTGKRSSPSAKSRALGEAFPECRAPSRGRFNTVGAISHFFYSSPSATLGEEISFFFEISSPSATLGEEIHFFLENVFPECLMTLHSGKLPLYFFKNSLPRVPLP
jgi:hypothetical protein